MDKLLHVMLLVLLILLKITGKILSDRNKCFVLLLDRLHGDSTHIIIATIIDIVTITVSSK